MKFCRSLMMLKALIEETLPDWQDKFLCYKGLKKQLNLIYPKEQYVMNVERKKLDDDDFLKLLGNEIDKFNDFFLEKEEDYIIEMMVLKDRVARIGSCEELMSVGKDLADLQGEMVLLANYSALNCTGLAKILKKYDKRSGSLILLPFMHKVILEEPFFHTNVVHKLVKECENMLCSLFSQNRPSNKTPKGEGSSGIKDQEELAEIENLRNSMYLKLTKSALTVFQEIRSESSTVSKYSFPPLTEED